MRRIAAKLLGLAFTAMVALSVSGTAQAQDNVWRIAKVTGQAWLGGDGVATVALSQQSVVKPGDSIRTGRNGRVLLIRGAETMMVSANSAISLPEVGRAGMTTVIQQAGSILLDVEKRNVQHFEVETPYLAAVVKGTRFTVTVANGRAQVNVARGQVQVADFRSGQFALVLPGQIARVAQRNVGLQLSGSGALGAIQQGPAQAPRIAPLPVPSQGFTAAPVRGEAAPPRPVLLDARAPRDSGLVHGRNGSLRIVAPIGDVTLDISKVTRGLARSETPTTGVATQRAAAWGNDASPVASNSASRSGPSSSFISGQTGNGSVAAGMPGALAGNQGAALIRATSGDAHTGVSGYALGTANGSGSLSAGAAASVSAGSNGGANSNDVAALRAAAASGMNVNVFTGNGNRNNGNGRK